MMFCMLIWLSCGLNIFRFLHPITYGMYPDSLRNIVGDRLPKFTKREQKLVKGSIDFMGLNHYTSYYAYDLHQNKSYVKGYSADWNVGFACKSFLFDLLVFAKGLICLEFLRIHSRMDFLESERVIILFFAVVCYPHLLQF